MEAELLRQYRLDLWSKNPGDARAAVYGLALLNARGPGEGVSLAAFCSALAAALGLVEDDADLSLKLAGVLQARHATLNVLLATLPERTRRSIARRRR